MADYITLLGAEDVRRAGSLMQSAADDMRCAASNMSSALEQHQRWMDDWLSRFQQVIETATNGPMTEQR